MLQVSTIIITYSLIDNQYPGDGEFVATRLLLDFVTREE